MSSQLALDPTAPSDAELIALVRGGDQQAYGALFERHRDAALRMARQLVPSADADDLVSDAFIKVHRVLSTGGGPDVAFRAYLLTAVRRLHVDRLRASSKVTTTDEIENFDPGVPFADPAVAEFENSAAAKAFANLPERWQMVLWHLEVEGQKPADIAPLLGMTANGVSALAYRAREGLRQEYLQMHLADTAAEKCRWVTERLGGYVRGGLSKRDSAKVQEHLDECPRCTAMYLELVEVNSNLAGIIAPLLLGTAAAGYLTSTGAAVGGAAILPLFGRVKDAVRGNLAVSGAVAASAAVIGLAAAGVIAGDDERSSSADVPPPIVPVVTSPSDESSTSSEGTAGTPPTSGPPRATSNSDDPDSALVPPGLPTSDQPTTSAFTLPTEPQSETPTSAPQSSPGATDSSTTDGTTGPTDTSPTAPTTSSTPTSTAPTTTPPTTPTSPTPTITATTTPTTPTIPTTPPVVADMSIELSWVNPDPRTYAFSVLLAGVPEEAVPTMTVEIPQFQEVAFFPLWSCTPPPSRDIHVYTCTPGLISNEARSDAVPDPLAVVRYHPQQEGRDFITTLSAEGVVDPDLSNNTDSLQGQ